MAEAKIREAQARGEFDDLPGAGAPLHLDDDALVPEELRVAYRLLRNAGFVPPELEAHRDIRELDRLLELAEERDERARLIARVNFLLSRTGRRRSLKIEQDYFEKVSERLEARRLKTTHEGR